MTQGYSDKQRQMIANGLSNRLTLAQISKHPDFIQAGREHAREVHRQKESWTTEQFLANYDGKGFKTREEREMAFSQRVVDPFSGITKDLAAVNPNYERALKIITNDTSAEIMGIYTPPPPKSLERQAQERLAELSNSKDPVVSAQAELDAIHLLSDPAWSAIIADMEPAPRPLEDFIKSQGPMRVQVGAQTQADADAQNEANARNPNDIAPTPTA
jgi:hypothetical protein